MMECRLQIIDNANDLLATPCQMRTVAKISSVPIEWKEVQLSDFVAKVLRLGFACEQLPHSHAEEQHQLLFKHRIKDEFLRWKSQEKAAAYGWDAHKRLLDIDLKQMRTMYYELPGVINDDSAEDMLALDALVVVVILVRYFGSGVQQIIPHSFFAHIRDSPEVDLRISNSKPDILRDLLLFEQQLPMSLLNKTMATFVCAGTEQGIADQLTREVIAQLMLWMYPFKNPDLRKSQHATGNVELPTAISDSMSKLLDYRHLLDCLYHITCTATNVEDSVHFSTRQVPSVSDLRKAGIRVTSRAGDDHIDKSRFEGAVLRLPQLSLNDNTASTLRNLAAFEILASYNQPAPLYLCQYLVLLGNLVQTTQDVNLLIKKDVIEVNCELGGNSEVEKMLNGLCRNMPVGGGSGTRKWHNMLAEIQRYYKNERFALLNEFMEANCSKPWVVVSNMVAASILSMAILQTIYTMLSFYHHTS